MFHATLTYVYTSELQGPCLEGKFFGGFADRNAVVWEEFLLLGW